MLKEERMGGNIANIVLAANVDWAKEKIQKEFLKHDLDDLIKMITDLGIPCGKIGPTEKWLDHPQVKAIGMRAEVKDPKRGETAMPGIPINLTKTPGKVHGPAPEAGAHTGKITVRPAPRAAGEDSRCCVRVRSPATASSTWARSSPVPIAARCCPSSAPT